MLVAPDAGDELGEDGQDEDGRANLDPDEEVVGPAQVVFQPPVEVKGPVKI